jgi:hypothetical protein
MSAIAEPFQHAKPNDNLARRNAMVLAVAQALAGGNNTVIVSTASIVGAVLAPDKGLATLPITAMVFGMWFGTLPLWRFGVASAVASRAAMPRPLGFFRSDFRVAVMNGISGCCWSVHSVAGSTLPRINPIGLPLPIPRATPTGRKLFPGSLRAEFSRR